MKQQGTNAVFELDGEMDFFPSCTPSDPRNSEDGEEVYVWPCYPTYWSPELAGSAGASMSRWCSNEHTHLVHWGTLGGIT